MAKFNKGQKVVVVNEGKCYTTYYSWVFDNKIFLEADAEVRELWAKYLAGSNDCEKGTFLTIVACGTHGVNRKTVMYLCEDSDGNPILINEEGLEPLRKGLEPLRKGLKWTDLKIGDIIKHKVHGYKYMITGIDSNLNVGNHVQVGGYWIDDDKLAELWEKVEE